MITWTLAASALVLLVLLVVLRTRVKSMGSRSEKIAALVIMGLLPGVWLLGTVDHTLKNMTTVEFCTQCHTMKDYGKSLHAEDSDDSLAASHYQNNRVPRHEACYECHADHRPVIGLIKTKLNGLREAYIEYIGKPHLPLKGKPFQNTNCLRCHAKAKNFRETHEDDLDDLLSGKTRCLEECHDVGHDLGGKENE